MDKKSKYQQFDQETLTRDWCYGIKRGLIRFKRIYFTIIIDSRNHTVGSEHPAVGIGRADGESLILGMFLLLTGVLGGVGPGVNHGVDHHRAEATSQEILLILLSEEVALPHMVRPVD